MESKSLTQSIRWFHQLIIAALACLVAGVCPAQAISCDEKNYVEFKREYPLLNKCSKLINSSGQTIFVLSRVQSDAVLKLKLDGDLKPLLDKVIALAVQSKGTTVLQSISMSLDPLSVGFSAMFWPRFRLSTDTIDIGFPVISEDAGRSAFSRAITSEGNLHIRLVTADRTSHDLIFELTNSSQVFLDTLSLGEIAQSGALGNIESVSRIKKSANKTCEDSSTNKPYWQCMVPVNECVFKSKNDASQLQACLDNLTK